MSAEIFVGLPDLRSDYVAGAVAIGAPILISANALARRWTVEMRESDEDHPGFRKPPAERLRNVRVALDSMGFTAMSLWGGFAFTAAQYIELAASHDFEFWSALDLCCEPEVARDGEQVLARIMETAWRYDELRLMANDRGIKDPLPVIQGWRWEQYLICAEQMRIGDRGETLIGIGSVCRRRLGGPDGVDTIIDRLDARMPKGVRFHLFGVTSEALAALSEHPRVASVDSQGWGYRLRRDHPTGRTNALAVQYMHDFVEGQRRHAAQRRPMNGTLELRERPTFEGKGLAHEAAAWRVLQLIRQGSLEAWQYELHRDRAMDRIERILAEAEQADGA